ncbi:penicillin acylase family protein [Spiractinospora alimapuensis]|uniref:penicillin acylase family protein n=1 Tax=Spiractinospora alimapuensis TaxID=2820884 RepID=UPI001F28136C|nr:penicillin acylase family protein [Spiractinospora alimapuensis]QVQ51831.1 penicillin acylase family protein [Spiractinospora alimapuensis]
MQRSGIAVRGLATAAAIVLMAPLAASSASGDEVTSYQTSHVDSEVEILVDEWGVPHIYADNSEDLFFAQGFSVARDRLFQMDLWRRHGLGELAEVLGPDYVETDTAARHFLYRGDIDEEWASYDPRTRNSVESFTEGINFYVDLVENLPGGLPPEFEELEYEPEHWSPEDVVRIRNHGLVYNLESEVNRSLIACDENVNAHRLEQELRPAWEPAVPEGLDVCAVPEEVLDTYRLATETLTFTGDGEVESVIGRVPGEGSNAWAVGPERTDTGRPILANDPHRFTPSPSVRYLQHLSTPEFDVVGAGEPLAPGVALGHNGSVAFGLTVFGIDQEDLYVYELNPDDPTQYRYDDGWESMDIVTEEVEVAGEEPVSVEVAFTRHGPVLYTDEENDTAFALRTVWLEPGTSPYLASMGMLDASDFDEFRSAAQDAGSPPLNYTYADAEGNIGWQPAGLTPVRPDHDGLLPVPGDGRYEWDGFRDPEELPHSLNPDDGFFANGNNLPVSDDLAPNYGFEWSAPYRYDRITEVLGGSSSHSVDGMAELQYDEVSLPARSIVPLLENLDPEDEAAAAAVALLTSWEDYDASADSAEAALFEAWLIRHLSYTLIYVLAPEAAERILVPDVSTIVDIAENPEDWFGPEGEATRDAMFEMTLASAFGDLTESLGPDPGEWRWGDLHHTEFVHPLGENVGPIQRGGAWETVNMSVYHPLTYQQIAGATSRVVIDVGAWDNSLAVNAPGQSGDPRSPHYDDLAPRWETGEYFPLLYSRDAIEEHTRTRILIQTD